MAWRSRLRIMIECTPWILGRRAKQRCLCQWNKVEAEHTAPSAYKHRQNPSEQAGYAHDEIHQHVRPSIRLYVFIRHCEQGERKMKSIWRYVLKESPAFLLRTLRITVGKATVRQRGHKEAEEQTADANVNMTPANTLSLCYPAGCGYLHLVLYCTAALDKILTLKVVWEERERKKNVNEQRVMGDCAE